MRRVLAKKRRLFLLLVFDVRRRESSSFVHGVDHGVVVYVVVALGVGQDALSTPVRRRSTTFIIIIFFF
jgi:hypothetical protein